MTLILLGSRAATIARGLWHYVCDINPSSCNVKLLFSMSQQFHYFMCSHLAWITLYQPLIILLPDQSEKERHTQMDMIKKNRQGSQTSPPHGAIHHHHQAYIMKLHFTANFVVIRVIHIHFFCGGYPVETLRGEKRALGSNDADRPSLRPQWQRVQAT